MWTQADGDLEEGRLSRRLIETATHTETADDFLFGDMDGKDSSSLKLNKVTQLLSGPKYTALPPILWQAVQPRVCTALSAEALGSCSEVVGPGKPQWSQEDRPLLGHSSLCWALLIPFWACHPFPAGPLSGGLVLSLPKWKWWVSVLSQIPCSWLGLGGHSGSGTFEVLTSLSFIPSHSSQPKSCLLSLSCLF